MSDTEHCKDCGEPITGSPRWYYGDAYHRDCLYATDGGTDTDGSERSWVSRTRMFCPECGQRGAAHGIQNVSKWMSCSNGHEWGYEDVE